MDKTRMSRESEVDRLMNLAAQGDEAARQQLLHRYREPLRRMVANRLDPRISSRVDPSDIVQDTLIEAARRMKDFLERRPIAFPAWLRQIAGERVIDAHRRHVSSQRRSVTRESQESRLPDQSASLLAQRLLDDQTSPSGQLMRREGLDRIREALAALKPNDREVLVMRHLEQLSIVEISQLLGLTEAAVKSRLLRGLIRLRSELEARQ